MTTFHSNIQRKQAGMYSMVLILFLVYSNRLRKACISLTFSTSSTQTKQPVVLSEEDEIRAMMLADDLLPSNKVPCGKEKCFYISSSNPNNGYLVARSGRHDVASNNHTEKFERLQQGWELATRLSNEYQIKHFLLSPPTTILVSDHLSSILNTNLWYETQDKSVEEANSKKRIRYPVNSNVYVEKVKVAPTPNILLACAQSNRPHFERNVDTFLMTVSSKFASTLSKNLLKTQRLLEKEPCLLKDFQVLVDRNGQIFHLDFDRCFHTRQDLQNETQQCYNYLNAVEQRIHNTLQDPFRAENINTEIVAPCGKEKCFFHTNSNTSIGYLVAKSSEKENRMGRFDSLVAGWQLAERLKREQGIQHFLLSPPANVTISKQLDAALNLNLWNEKRLRPPKEHRFQQGQVAYVQKVQVAPEPNLLLGCVESKMQVFEKLLKQFMIHVNDTRAFERRFVESFAQARNLLNVEPCLIKDFQALVDTKGNVYHLDFDRCFSPENGTKKYTEEEDLKATPCMFAMNEIERQVHKAVEQSLKRDRGS